MRRRDFIALLGGIAAAWPLPAQAQKTDRLARIGVLMGFGALMGLGEDDPVPNVWLSGFTQGLSDLGWTDGRNLRMVVRWTGAGLQLTANIQPKGGLAYPTQSGHVATVWRRSPSGGPSMVFDVVAVA
jgi:hypothetical protein